MEGKYNILVVDDDKVNRDLMKGILSAEGFDVCMAESGEECLRMIHGQDPDLVVLDVMMPNMDGFEVCVKLKADTRTKAIPVIFVTALNRLEDILRGYSVGGVDFIPKPIDRALVVARVKALLLMHMMVKDRENLLKANQALIGRLENLLSEPALQTQLSLIKKDVGEATEDMFSKLQRLRSETGTEENDSLIDQIELSLQFTDKLCQQINEIAKIVNKLQNLIQGVEDESLETADESSKSVIMQKKDQAEIDNLLESLGL